MEETRTVPQYDLYLTRSSEVWTLGSAYVPTDATPRQALRAVIDLLRAVADEMERRGSLEVDLELVQQ